MEKQKLCGKAAENGYQLSIGNSQLAILLRWKEDDNYQLAIHNWPFC